MCVLFSHNGDHHISVCLHRPLSKCTAACVDAPQYTRRTTVGAICFDMGMVFLLHRHCCSRRIAISGYSFRAKSLLTSKRRVKAKIFGWEKWRIFQTKATPRTGPIKWKFILGLQWKCGAVSPLFRFVCTHEFGKLTLKI